MTKQEAEDELRQERRKTGRCFLFIDNNGDIWRGPEHLEDPNWDNLHYARLRGRTLGAFVGRIEPIWVFEASEHCANWLKIGFYK